MGYPSLHIPGRYGTVNRKIAENMTNIVKVLLGLREQDSEGD